MEYPLGVIYNSLERTNIQKFYIEKLAEHNIVHGMCGNISPSLYSDGEGGLHIASILNEDWYFDENTGKYDENSIKNANPSDYPDGAIEEVYCLSGEDKAMISGWRNEGMIITDLWAYTVVDLKVYEELLGHKYSNDGLGFIVKVKPGKYKFTHYTDNNYYEYTDNVKVFGFGEYLGE